MKLGAFSLSLNVKDLQTSKQFYQRLGFQVFAGQEKQNWLIMSNGEHKIGLFQGMFEQNMMTFNPGWDNQGQELESFTDIREIQQAIQQHDIAIDNEVDAKSSGPAFFMIKDPDGNPILIDQHL